MPPVYDGALYHEGYIANIAANYNGSNLGGLGVTFNASRSSDRYGSYTEVRPLYESCKYLISY